MKIKELKSITGLELGLLKKDHKYWFCFYCEENIPLKSFGWVTDDYRVFCSLICVDNQDKKESNT